MQIIVYAIISLTALATKSIQEDSYGKVARDIPLLVRTFVSTHRALETFTRTLAPHWTDVGFSEGDRRVKDVEIVLAALRKGLGEIVDGFGGFAGEIGLGDRELEVARGIAGTEKKS